MRIHLFRGIVASTVLLALAAAPAFAQFSVVRGKVLDPDGNPVEGAVIRFEEDSGTQKTEARSNKNGEFQQLGLRSGTYSVTAEKEGVGKLTLNNYEVKQSLNAPLEFTLVASGSAGPDLTTGADGNRLPEAVVKEIQAAVTVAFQAMETKDYPLAIQNFTTIIGHVPACTECYFNMAVAYAQSSQLEDAEKAFLKVIELEAESPDAYRGLAAIYNAQKRFDDAAKANAKANELSGGDATLSADDLYSQAVVLWNNQQAAPANELFQKAAAADPNHALAHYYLGITSLNLGKLPEALAAFEKYLALEPEGDKAAEVKSFVTTLKQ